MRPATPLPTTTPTNADNRSAIERFGGVRVLAELPRVDPLAAAAVARLTELVPPLGEIAP